MASTLDVSEISRILSDPQTLMPPFNLVEVQGQWNWTLCSQPSNFVCQAHYTADIKTDVVIRRKKPTVILSF
jgi:hypothetical protein